ncbi:hypothetical protein G1C96_1215 [Bifidobacterium sp. DSM 109958]|uniref:DUF805 domain-containing protein n=1 Tax=Bifidobacterium moraviense TaxID=2675323 RepID=A0A7Y0HXW4_9BIFI|nr:DUF805 domain-containing protein [Bifidobacterium sp. DSM 109958]NMN00636.1 hypothetical protein [Bifidobacterium sp. DSM 109958]
MTDPNPQQPSDPQNPQYQQQAAQQPTQPTQSAQPQAAYQQPQPEYGAYASQYQAQYQTPQYQTPQGQQPAQPQPEYGQYAPQNQQPPYQQPYQTQYQQQPPQYGQQYAQPGANPNPFAQQNANPYANPNPYAQGTQGTYGAPLPQGAPAAAYMTEPPLNMPWYGIGFGEAIKRLFQKIVVWKGRASRGEFWWAILFLWLVGFGIGFVGSFLGDLSTGVSAVWNIASSLILLPIAIRRLHDTDRSGWFVLFYAVPTVLNWVVGATTARPLMHELENAAPSLMSIQSEAQLEAWIMNLMEQYANTFVLIGLISLLSLVGTIVMIVMLAGRTKPEGARFDV